MVKKIFSILTLSVLYSIFFVNTSFAQGCMDAGSDEGVNIKGYIQPQYEFYQTADTGYANSFTFNRARIAALGNIPYDISYFIMVDFSRFKSDNFLLDGFISYTRYDWLKVTFGQFKSPISLEQNTPCQSLHTIYRSKVVNELAGPQRDMGLMLFGGNADSKFHYYASLMNDYAKGFQDENNNKSFKGRITYSPLAFLQVGGSFAQGITGAKYDNKKTRIGGELQVKHNNFLLQGEYIWGDDTGDYTTGGGCDGTPIEFHTGGVKRHGYFAHVMYMTSINLQPVFKFEGYDSDLSIDSNTETIMTFGLNYFLNDWTRIQLNYRYKAEKGAEVPNDQLVLQAQIKF